jgi:hypothetical protein
MNSTDLSRGDEEPDVFSEDRQDDEVDDYEDTTGLL